jgi:Phosphoserine phosphatase RsbU, N-terminal domain
MGTRSPSFRRYYTALLDYVLRSGESSLAHAYELGRTGFDTGFSLLRMLHMHSEAVNTILESTPAGDEFRRRVNASTEFLMEAVSPFEMAYQGYRAVLKASSDKRQQRRTSRLSSHDGR